ncbi:MAG: LysM peptidoglycan-binding domain-containing protein, partial [Candidatus Binataceae bacterium]
MQEDAGESKVDLAARPPVASIMTAGPSLAIAAIMTVVVAIAAGSGCSASGRSNQRLTPYNRGSQPVEHVVRRGETVYHIAHVYGVSVQSLLEANHLSDSRDLR